jgi:predicted transcriptional regulator
MLGVREISNRNRSRFEIIAEILRELHKPTGRGNIMSRCNMSSMQSGEYLSFMKSNNLIRTDTMTGKVVYERTETGQEFLKLFNKMIPLLDSSISACP